MYVVFQDNLFFLLSVLAPLKEQQNTDVAHSIQLTLRMVSSVVCAKPVEELTSVTPFSTTSSTSSPPALPLLVGMCAVLYEHNI